MWGNGRRLSALVSSVLVLLCLSTSLCLGKTCSDEALRTFSHKGADAAFHHFHALLEEKRCREEPAFLVNLAQAYKSKSADPANSCRAHFAYEHALESKSLLSTYVRVARKGKEQTARGCERFMRQVYASTVNLEQRLESTSLLVRRGAVHLALREYQVLMEISPGDNRPVRGLCKTARLAQDERTLQICQKRSDEIEALRIARASEMQGQRIALWATSGLAIIAAGAATWYGVEMFEQYDRTVDAHEESILARNAMDEASFMAAQRREESAGQQTVDAQRLMYWSVAVAGIASVAAFTVWQADTQVSVTLVSPASLGVSASF